MKDPEDTKEARIRTSHKKKYGGSSMPETPVPGVKKLWLERVRVRKADGET